MHKLIGPTDLVAASRWYLMLLKGVAHGVTFDEFLQLMASTPGAGKADKPRAARARLSRLVTAGMVQKSGTRRSLTFSLSKAGQRQLELLSFLEIKPPSNFRWDKSWRIIMFDIPESSRKSRGTIRRLLQELGFMQLQLSVWIHPLPCLDNFEQLRKAYGIEEHIFLIETLNFDAPLPVLQYFQKTYPNIGIQA